MAKSFYVSDNGGPCVLHTIPVIESTSVMDVDYSQTIVSLISSKGFDKDVGYILNDENLPSKEIGQHRLDTAVFHFDDIATVNSLESAISKMAEAGYRPATIKELLHYPKNKIPDNHRVFRLLALGSIADFGGWHKICEMTKVKFQDRVRLQAIIPHRCFGYEYRFLGIKK